RYGRAPGEPAAHERIIEPDNDVAEIRSLQSAQSYSRREDQTQTPWQTTSLQESEGAPYAGFAPSATIRDCSANRRMPIQLEDAVYAPSQMWRYRVCDVSNCRST